MRRKTKAEETTDSLTKPGKSHQANEATCSYTISDIRTLYILLILSFIDTDSSAQIKTTFLEQHRDPFLSIFKGLIQDSYAVARKILEVCWSGIWSDPKIKRTMKIGLFNETTISHVSQEFNYSGNYSSLA
jgi:nucleolar pre-ribosomal-associated protein 1